MTAFWRALSILVVIGCTLAACGSGSDGTAAESSLPSMVGATGPVALSMTIANVSYNWAC